MLIPGREQNSALKAAIQYYCIRHFHVIFGAIASFLAIAKHMFASSWSGNTSFLLSTSCKKLSTRRLAEKTQIKLEYFFWFFSILFDSKMSSGGAPESWDEDLNAPMSSLNVNATEFVPSWGMPPSANSAPVQSPQTSKRP